jgi:hypothetical protein
MATSVKRAGPVPGRGAGVSFRPRERWVLLVASVWLVVGLQLDAYAHATTPELETFWTPWHGVLYSGIAACGFTLLWLLRPRLPAIPTYSSVLALPNALRVPLIGMALLLVGGGVDTLWHNVFGIERDLEIFVSPSHELIIAGMVLVAAGPALMLATEPGRTLSLAGGTLATISALFSVLPLHIYSLHASVLGYPFFGDEFDRGPVRIYSRDAQEMHGYLFSTVLLLLPILIMGRRWRLPPAVPTVLVAVPAAGMHLMFATEDPWWPVNAVVTGAAVAEALLRIGERFVPVPEEAGWAIAGFVSPPLVWGTLLAVGATEDGVNWNIHMVTGLLTLVAITGLVTTLVTRNVRPAPAPIAAPAAGEPVNEPAAGKPMKEAAAGKPGEEAAAGEPARPGAPAK